MVNKEETKKIKAQNLRYKKPIAKNLNLDAITQDLWNMQEVCEEIRWYTDSEDGGDSLINALSGDEDEAYVQNVKECLKTYRKNGCRNALIYSLWL